MSKPKDGLKKPKTPVSESENTKYRFGVLKGKLKIAKDFDAPLPEYILEGFNKTTLEAHQEALEGGGTAYESMDDFWSDMGIDRRAKT